MALPVNSKELATWTAYSDETLKNVFLGHCIAFPINLENVEFRPSKNDPNGKPRARFEGTILNPKQEKVVVPIYLTKDQIGKTNIAGVFEMFPLYKEKFFPVYLVNIEGNLHCHIHFAAAPAIVANDFFGMEVPESETILPELRPAGVNAVKREAPVATVGTSVPANNLADIF